VRVSKAKQNQIFKVVFKLLGYSLWLCDAFACPKASLAEVAMKKILSKFWLGIIIYEAIMSKNVL
jgi:hypothetical protein